jgi:hypothetical protein
MERLIYNSEELETFSKDTIERINKAVVASAIRIRDIIRSTFLRDASSLYKTHNGNISHLTSGIMIGRDQGGSIKIHAMGNKEDYDSYKTRFFIGGTRYRRQTKRKGKPIKPFTKGFIKPTDSLVKVMETSEPILINYIKRAIDG